MARYRLQIYNSKKDIWNNTDTTFNTKKQLDQFIGEYNKDYDWRAGYCFKPVGAFVSMRRFVWDTDKRKGEEVKV